jgi:hypothetical protein
MPQYILNNIFIDFLNCEYKAYLKLDGKFGKKSEYEKLHGHLRKTLLLDLWLNLTNGILTT